MPHTFANWIRLSPPVAALRTTRTALRRRSLSFALFLLLHDIGAFAGLVDRDLLGRHHAR